MAFWLIVILLLGGAGALLVIPAMRKETNSTATTRDALNKAIYQDRLSELAEDEAQGVVEQQPELIQELQQNLLTDIPQHSSTAASPINRWVLLPGGWF